VRDIVQKLSLKSVPNIKFLYRFGVETVIKMVDWALDHVPPASRATILEVGSGNGTLLLDLLEAGYDGSTLHGIDYSEGAVKLARSVAASRGGSDIVFNHCDFLLDDPPTPTQDLMKDPRAVWDLILDKGTFDAIALGEKDESGNSPAIYYPDRVARLLKSGGVFLITCQCFTIKTLMFELEKTFLSVQFYRG